MGDLLQRVPMVAPAANRAPLFVEIPVHPDGAPFLVSGPKGWVWIPGSRTGIVRSAVRTGVIPNDIAGRIVEEIVNEGSTNAWGNSFSFSEDGLKAAIEYVSSYGMTEVDVLAHAGFSLDLPKGVKLSESEWVPPNKAVVVPRDRTYLGLVGTFGSGFYTVVVHNPSRGMAVMGAW